MLKYFKDLKDFTVAEDEYTAVTFGKFDGLHRGHQKLISCVKSHSSDKIKSVICAFDMNEFLSKRGMQVETLMTKQERCSYLQGEVDVLIDCPFTDEICNIEAEDFIRKILVEQMHIRYIAVGTDFTFGHGRRGDYHMLKKYADVYHYQVDVVQKEMYKGREISSTYIREMVGAGKIGNVNAMLGYPFSIDGTVIHGNHIGRTIGIPTVNITPGTNKMLPPNGVYVSRVKIDGKWCEGVTNIGTKPTVQKELIKGIETHLFDFNEDIYDKEISVQLFYYIRPEMKFLSLDELKRQMNDDIIFGRKYFEERKEK